MFTAAVGFLIGCAGLWAYDALPPAAAWACVALFFACILTCFQRFSYRGVLIFLMFVAWGQFWSIHQAEALEQWHLDKAAFNQTQTATIEILSIPESKRHYQQFDARLRAIDDQPVQNAMVRLNWYNHIPKSLQPGQIWQVQLRLKPIRGLANPGGGDSAKRAFAQGVRARGYVIGANARLMGVDAGWSQRIDLWRYQLNQAIERRLATNAMLGFIQALTVGVRVHINSAQWRDLQRTGIGHLVAISGLHIGLVGGFAYWIGGWLWRRSAKLCSSLPAHKFGAVLALISAFFYSALAGFSVPTQRAMIMLAVFMLARILDQPRHPWSCYWLSMLVVLLINPFSVVMPGFWLSFGAVGLLLYGLTFRVANRGKWRQILKAQFVVTIGLLPLSVWFFHQTSVVAPLVNLIAVPWVSFLVVPLALVGCVLYALSHTVAGGCWEAAAWLMAKLWLGISWISPITLAQWSFAEASFLSLLLAVIGSLWLLAPTGWPGRCWGFGLWLPLFFPTLPSIPAGHAKASILDVGQGQAVVLQTQNHTVLYDTGPGWGQGQSAADWAIHPFLKHEGIRHLDRIVLSHGDADHSGGLISIQERFPGVILITPDEQRYRGAIPCRAGTHWNYDGVEFMILYPHQVPTPLIDDNQYSCVLKVQTGSSSFLLTGDIEKKAEHELVSTDTAALQSSVLLVPHHGSATSSTTEFIQAVDPQWVIFSVGYLNQWHFPNPTVAARYRQQGVTLLNTAESGAIRFELTPKGIRNLRGFRKKTLRFYQ